MNVSVLVGTYGTVEWLTLGGQAANAAHEACPGAQVVTQHEELETLATVRNRLAQIATGDWLCFLDADDRLAPGYLDAMRACLEQAAISQPVLLLPAVQYVQPDGQPVAAPAVPAWGRYVLDVNAGVIGTLVPRDLFLEVGGFREWPLYEDWDLWLRCLAAGASPVAVPGAVYLADATAGRNEEPAGREETYWAIRHEHAAALAGRRWA